MARPKRPGLGEAPRVAGDPGILPTERLLNGPRVSLSRFLRLKDQLKRAVSLSFTPLGVRIVSFEHPCSA